MSENNESSKDDVYYKICNSVLKLEVSKGHLKWTVSEISRHSGVTRSLIYYYFGKEKKTILDEAYRFMTEVVFNVKRQTSLGLKQRIKLVLKDLEKMPYLFILYYLEKGKESEASEIIHKAEMNLLENLGQAYPELSEDEILKIYLLELGAIAFKLPIEKSDSIFSSY